MNFVWQVAFVAMAAVSFRSTKPDPLMGDLWWDERSPASMKTVHADTLSGNISIPVHFHASPSLALHFAGTAHRSEDLRMSSDLGEEASERDAAHPVFLAMIVVTTWMLFPLTFMSGQWAGKCLGDAFVACAL
jgi:hypothetical protein